MPRFLPSLADWYDNIEAIASTNDGARWQALDAVLSADSHRPLKRPLARRVDELERCTIKLWRGQWRALGAT
jgi:hypothetical protein